MKVINHGLPDDAFRAAMLAAIEAMKTALQAAQVGQPGVEPVHFVLVVIPEGPGSYPRVASNFTPDAARELFALLATIPNDPQETMQ